KLFKADNPNIQYFGRVDFSDPMKPRFWAGGVYIRIKFKGTSCQVMMNDEELGGNNHNYIEIVVDNVPRRIQTTGKANVINIADSLSDGVHEAIICKDTESGIGYPELTGVKCAKLLPPGPKPTRKIEYIGDSITAGTGMDLTIPCDKGPWYDQHNAYMSYGARTSRALDAQWQLTAVAGIGLTHSCCKMDIIMPDVLDKMDLRDNKIAWDFQKYQPDVVTICLGQNDGIVDSTKFCSAYVAFIGEVRESYPKADIILLTSPMGNQKLTAVLKNYLTSVLTYLNDRGDKKIYKYFFSRSFNSGCGGHPDMAEHGLIAQELTAYVKQVEGW
ncbi:MAG: SGNH/GDSL hydrolase family protein, partial [Mucilaginibacter sp.]